MIVAGKILLIVLQSPCSSHSQVNSFFFIASSASSFVWTLNMLFQDLPIADSASSNSGTTRTYLTPNFSRSARNFGW